jgi:hypothetical protein
VNGINTEYNWMEWRTQMNTLQEAKIDGFSFTETNLRWTPEQTQAARQCGRYWFKQFRLQSSSSNDPTTRASYQPGGTCTGVTNKLAGRITHQGSDPSELGRWSYVCLEGKQIGTDDNGINLNRKVNIITAYLVAQKDSAYPGHDTAFMQQTRLLTLSGNTNPKPRKQGFLDLTKQIQSMQKDDAEVLLLTDANADILDPDFHSMIKETGLVDLMEHKLGTNLPETYIRGTKRVDHAYGSKRLTGTVERAGYLAYNDGIITDHRGFFLDFNGKALFGPDQTIDNREGRLLTTTNKRGATQYRTAASRAIISNKILHRLNEIEKATNENFTPQVIADFEAVDTEFHTILLAAKKTIAKHSHLPWSPDLHKAYKIWKYWKVRLSYFKTKRIPGTRVKNLLGKWEKDYEVFQGDSTKTISRQLRKAKKALQQCRQDSHKLRLTHMERIAMQYEIDDDTDRAKIIKRIIRAEEQAKMYRTLRRYLKPPAQNLNYVEVPTDPEEDLNTATKWRTIFDKDELEKTIVQKESNPLFSSSHGSNAIHGRSIVFTLWVHN